MRQAREGPPQSEWSDDRPDRAGRPERYLRTGHQRDRQRRPTDRSIPGQSVVARGWQQPGVGRDRSRGHPSRVRRGVDPRCCQIGVGSPTEITLIAGYVRVAMGRLPPVRGTPTRATTERHLGRVPAASRWSSWLVAHLHSLSVRRHPEPRACDFNRVPTFREFVNAVSRTTDSFP